MDLDSKKYSELQSIAKDLGLKANMKAEKLLKAIKQHYQQEKNKEQNEQNDAVAVKEDENAAHVRSQKNKEVSSPAVFVNIRRGKGHGTKRKISDTATVSECDAKGDAEAAVYSKPKGAKQRKVSSVSTSDKAETEPPNETKAGENEPQPAIKDEVHVGDHPEKAPKISKAGKIPRYQGSQQKNKPVLKPVTPNFKKLHEAHFNKMESIDSYVQRKTKQMDAYRNSVKELKILSDKTKQQEVDAKTQPKANRSCASMFSPIPVSKKLAEEKRRHTLLSASKVPPKKPAGKEDAPFRPSVLSTRRINVRFSEATRDNEFKRSLVKTPARMSPCVTSSTPQKQPTDAVKPNDVKTSALSVTKTPGPFIFTGNTSTSATPGTQKKPSFDLKASLSRPLNYKPHAGKLKPFGEIKENPTKTGNTPTVSNSHQKNYKQHQVKTREDRRAKHVEERKQKKQSVLGARRGLVMM